MAIQFGNGVSFGVTAGGNYGKGYGNGDETTYTYSHVTVLTPQVYLVARNLDVTPQGALISAREIVGNINGDIQNSGTIAGQNLTALSAKNIQNHGIVLGKTIWIFVEIIVEKKYTITTSIY